MSTTTDTTGNGAHEVIVIDDAPEATPEVIVINDTPAATPSEAPAKRAKTSKARVDALARAMRDVFDRFDLNALSDAKTNFVKLEEEGEVDDDARAAYAAVLARFGVEDAHIMDGRDAADNAIAKMKEACKAVLEQLAACVGEVDVLDMNDATQQAVADIVRDGALNIDLDISEPLSPWAVAVAFLFVSVWSAKDSRFCALRFNDSPLSDVNDIVDTITPEIRHYMFDAVDASPDSIFNGASFLDIFRAKYPHREAFCKDFLNEIERYLDNGVVSIDDDDEE